MAVVQAANVITQTGVKQVGQGASDKCGQLIIMCEIGNTIVVFMTSCLAVLVTPTVPIVFG